MHLINQINERVTLAAMKNKYVANILFCSVVACIPVSNNYIFPLQDLCSFTIVLIYSDRDSALLNNNNS